MKYKLVALDLDGTLLNSQQEISEKNMEVITKLIAQGVFFTLASGRPYQSVKPYAEMLGIDFPLILTNGAYLRSIGANDAFYQSTIAVNKVEKVVAYGLEEGFAVILYYEDIFLTFDQESIGIQKDLEDIDLKLIKELPGDKKPLKIVFRGSEELINQKYYQIRNLFTKSFYLTQSDRIYLEFMNQGVSKGIGLSKIITELNIKPKEVIAIGNNYNDLSMFRVAGISVAMQNSPNKVKELADLITLSNDQDGVAQALIKLCKME